VKENHEKTKRINYGRMAEKNKGRKEKWRDMRR